ncbi:hypothetical protein JW968_02590 [Candidatus Woesearchaeota archaeon]|nr:hypothetical protein [Candidatus Woesearchaeota archaeon]
MDELKTNFKVPEGHVCQGCLKYEQFGPKCWVYWEKKKICTHRVVNVDELSMEKMMK